LRSGLIVLNEAIVASKGLGVPSRSTNSVVLATLKATRSIPIVFTWVSDPLGSGFVTNLPHPGGNITGFLDASAYSPDRLHLPLPKHRFSP
jgi:ABC-type uncharacterized transport system substrate-binding protein